MTLYNLTVHYQVLGTRTYPDLTKSIANAYAGVARTMGLAVDIKESK